jgi:aldehyde:ferredoxin oxidoreductase
MECYEKGILTKEQLNNLDLTWGNAEAARLLLNLIANKQGIGETLSEGAMRAAQKIGGEATNFAIHTMKGNSPRGHDHRNRWTEMFDTVISNTGTLETWGVPSPLGPTPHWKDIAEANVHDKGGMIFEDSLVVCRFNSRTNVELLSQALSAVTGWDFSYDEAFMVGRRIVHLLRAFNIKHGIVGKNFDKPSPRYGSTPDSGPSKDKSLQDDWDKMLDAYYAGMGWDSSGKPLPETLEKYGLGYVAKDLYQK